LACTNSAVALLQQVTRTVPIVFTITVDPVGAGLVASLAPIDHGGGKRRSDPR
jgi:hypothetical protein